MKISSFKTELKKISAHEAAHAYCAWRLGRCLIGVTLNGRPDFQKKSIPLFSAGYCPASGIGPVDYDDILIYAAPGYFEDNLFGKISDGSLNNLREMITSILKQNRKMIPTSRAAEMAVKKTADPRKQEILFYKLLKPKIAKIFSGAKDKKAVKVLAAKLFEHGSLNGFETAVILEKAFGSLPEGALPASCHASRAQARTDRGRYIFAAKCLKDALEEIQSGADNPFEDKIANEILRLKFLVEAAAS